MEIYIGLETLLVKYPCSQLKPPGRRLGTSLTEVIRPGHKIRKPVALIFAEAIGADSFHTHPKLRLLMRLLHQIQSIGPWGVFLVVPVGRQLSKVCHNLREYFNDLVHIFFRIVAA